MAAAVAFMALFGTIKASFRIAEPALIIDVKGLESFGAFGALLPDIGAMPDTGGLPDIGGCFLRDRSELCLKLNAEDDLKRMARD